MSKRVRREMERTQAKIAARPVKPTPEEQKARAEAARQTLLDTSKSSILASLEAHKKCHGSGDLDRATVGAALVTFANLLGRNGRFVPGRDTEALIRFGIDVISQAAADAKRVSEEKRIVTF